MVVMRYSSHAEKWFLPSPWFSFYCELSGLHVENGIYNWVCFDLQHPIGRLWIYTRYKLIHFVISSKPIWLRYSVPQLVMLDSLPLSYSGDFLFVRPWRFHAFQKHHVLIHMCQYTCVNTHVLIHITINTQIYTCYYNITNTSLFSKK